jgi:DNA polymerase-3 subunit epsilon
MPSWKSRKPFTVIDVETTGLNPLAHDRIIEVAVVSLDADLTIVDEYITLVNPQRDIGRSDIHGITSSDILSAPTFDKIAGDIGARISDTIIVGHHVRFDIGFLKAEYSRIGIACPDFPTLCTLELSHQILDEVPSRKLHHCCEAFGIQLSDAHSALGDARATAGLLRHYFSSGRIDSVCLTSILELQRKVAALGWLPLPCTGITVTRAESANKAKEDRTYLAQLVERMLGDDSKNASEGDYLALLDRALEDRLISKAEAESLIESAQNWGMSRPEVLNAHRSYLRSLASEALSDGTVTPTEYKDLEQVCEMLDLSQASLAEALRKPLRNTSVKVNIVSMTGLSVCFTGELLGSIEGQRITRQMAQEFATRAGLIVRNGVTMDLDLLVVVDPNTQSGKAKKARQYGSRIMAEAAFWHAIGLSVE